MKNKKLKINSLVGLVLVTLLAVFFGMVNNVATAESTFYFNSESGEILGFVTDPIEDVVVQIPDKIDGKPVTALSTSDGTAIGFNQASCIEHIVGVDLSQATNLVDIGIGVFNGCSNITGTITLNSNIKTIQRQAFAGVTKIDKVVVLHTDNSLTLKSTSFAEGTTFVFKSQEIMNLYQDNSAWEKYNLTYEQSTPEIETSTQTKTVKYGETCILNPNIDGSYSWETGSEVVSTDSVLSLDLEVGSYVYTCTITTASKITTITYNINVSALEYEFDWPVKARYEYYDINDSIFLNNTQKDDLTIKYYKDSGSGYELVNSFSIGNFKAVVEPNSDNYFIENDSFEFIIDYTYLNISWGSNEFQYTGTTITPTAYLVGNTRTHNVTLNLEGDISAINVGNYTITVAGLSNEYYKLENGSVTTFNWSIKSTQLTIEWGANTFTYSSETFSPVAYGKYDDITIPLVVKSADGKTFNNAGTYNLIVEIPAEYTGFTLSGELSGKLTINPKKLDVVFTCLDEYTYSGEYVEITAEISTIVESSLSLILEGNYYKDAGQYTAVVTGTNNPNYYVESGISFDWKILPKSLVVNWHTAGIRYTGKPLKPSTTVDTGIDGEELELIINTDENINANEDSLTGYVAIATLPIDGSNYALINAETTYFIHRAVATLYVDDVPEVVYTGENQLPHFEYIGDEGNLKIYINGVETSSGVKEVGSYEIQFKSPKSANYKEILDEHIYTFIIKPATIENTVGDTKVVLTNNVIGFANNFLDVKEVVNYPLDIISGIENAENYNVEKVLEIGNAEDFEESTITISLKKVKSKNVRIFVLQDNKLVEKECIVEGKEVSFVGGVGTYFILVEKPAWIASTAGILTITLSFVSVISLIFAFMMIGSKKQTGEKLIASLIEARIQEKISKGEQVSTEDTLKIREEIIKEIHDNKKENK